MYFKSENIPATFYDYESPKTIRTKNNDTNLVAIEIITEANSLEQV